MAAHAHRPTQKMRDQVEAYAGIGVPHHDIAKLQKLSTHTLLKHYSVELGVGKARANAQVANSLFRMATSGGNVAAAIFWMKAQAGWRETPLQTPLDGGTAGATVNILVGEGGRVVTAEQAQAVYLEVLGNPKATLKGITYEGKVLQ